MRPFRHLTVVAVTLLACAACGADSVPPTAVTNPTGTVGPATTPATSSGSAAPAATLKACASPHQLEANVDDFCDQVTLNPASADGLQYGDFKVGTGPAATSGQTVNVQYTGWLADGTKFDSSRDRGQPFSFPLGQGHVIQGWDEGVAGMKAGGKRRLVIPGPLGYGAQGSPPQIPANATLIFDVELVSIG